MFNNDKEKENNMSNNTEEKINIIDIIDDTKVCLKVLTMRRVESLVKDCFAGISMDRYFEDILFTIKHTEELLGKLDKITKLRLDKLYGSEIRLHK